MNSSKIYEGEIPGNNSSLIIDGIDGLRVLLNERSVIHYCNTYFFSGL